MICSRKFWAKKKDWYAQIRYPLSVISLRFIFEFSPLKRVLNWSGTTHTQQYLNRDHDAFAVAIASFSKNYDNIGMRICVWRHFRVPHFSHAIEEIAEIGESQWSSSNSLYIYKMDE